MKAPTRLFWAAILAASGMLCHAQEPIRPLLVRPSLDTARVELGKTLFFDPRLSASGQRSCATCHRLDHGGGDGLRFSSGDQRQPLPTHTPSIFNAALNFRQGWAGRFDSLAAITDSLVGSRSPAMGADWPTVLEKLSANPVLRQHFTRVYGSLTRENVVDALVTFQRSLITPNSRFDRYLAGDHKALTETEVRGYRMFKQYGCASCHQGINIGGNMYQTFGVLGDYFAQRGGPPSHADLGRFNVTRAEADRHVFKVPSLRNVALTAPYFHDASAATLADAVAVMFRYQLGRAAPAQDKADIIAFLNTLSGEYAGKPLDRAP